MATKDTALVLGATGGIGGEVARALLARGWVVRALARHEPPADADTRIQWQRGDAMDAQAVRRAAEGATLIVHAVNPPGYRDWATVVMPMLENTIAAARALGARILLPGTLYNYGPGTFPVIAEDAPQDTQTVKGRIRVTMEARLREAAAEGVQVLIVRAGDYFGPRAGNAWFGQMVTPGKPVTVVKRIGKPGIGHQWAYLPDVAETMASLVSMGERLRPFENIHMHGHWDEDGTQMAVAVRRAAGDNARIAAFPWWAVSLAWPFVRIFRELRELRYLWRQPVRLGGSRLRELLGAEPHTPLDEAVAATLRGQGCIGRP
jgi:nucleoside-diphosphate-sugar epimerase